MRTFFNIFKSRNKHSEEIHIDDILKQHQLDFSDLNFAAKNPDIVKSFKSLNDKLNKGNNLISNIKSLLPRFDFKPILKPVYTIALTSLIIISYFFLKQETTPVQYAEISVDKGEKITIHVTDFITVYLNSESTLKVPLEIKRNSHFILTGEAIFKNKGNKKIMVSSNGVTVEAKSAEFYMNSKNANQLTVNNISGDVVVYNSRFPNATALSLKKDQKINYIVSAGFMSVESEEDQNFMAWHTGVMQFTNTPLESVINELTNYFEIPISITNENLLDKKITAEYQNLTIDNILDKLQLTLNCQISADGSKIVIN